MKPAYIVITVLMTAIFYVSGCSSISGASTGLTGPVLQASDTNTGRIYAEWAFNDSDEFSIGFIHSVNQSPVRETYTIKDGKILLLSIHFYSFGAGVQSDLGEGQSFGRDGDAMIISGFSNSYNELNLITGASHILFIDNEAINLLDLAGIYGKNAHITLQYSFRQPGENR